MSYELYWDGRPELVIPYRKADILRQKRENNNAWLQGAYIEYVAGLGYVCPGSQQYAVGTNFHGTAVVVYGELLETEKWVGHLGSYKL